MKHVYGGHVSTWGHMSTVDTFYGGTHVYSGYMSTVDASLWWTHTMHRTHVYGGHMFMVDACLWWTHVHRAHRAWTYVYGTQWMLVTLPTCCTVSSWGKGISRKSESESLPLLDCRGWVPTRSAVFLLFNSASWLDVSSVQLRLTSSGKSIESAIWMLSLFELAEAKLPIC